MNFMTRLIVSIALLSVVGCDADTTPNPTGDDTVVPDDSTNPPDTGDDMGTQPDTQPDTKPDVGHPPDTEPTTSKYCTKLKTANVCRTWEAFELEGKPYKGEIKITCKDSEDPEHPDTCAVTQTNDHVFIFNEFTVYGTEVPTVDQPLSMKDSGYEATLWIENPNTPDSTLHIVAKTPTPEQFLLISR